MNLLRSHLPWILLGNVFVSGAYSASMIIDERNLEAGVEGRNLTDSEAQTDCFEVKIGECEFSFNTNMISCNDWKKSIHGCDQSNVTIGYTVMNIVAAQLEAKILEGFGPFIHMPLLSMSNESEGINILNTIISEEKSLSGNYDIVDLDLCSLSEKIGINITKGVAGGESKNATDCKEASDFIQITMQEPDETESRAPSRSKGKGKGATKAPKSTGKGTKMKGSKSPKATKGGKGKGNYFEYVCNDGNAVSPTHTSSPSITSAPSTFESSKTTKSKSAKGKGASTGSGSGNTFITAPVPKTCEECMRLMNEPIEEPRSRPKDLIYYGVKITTTTTEVKSKDVKVALLQVLNGYFKAKLSGCSVNDDSRRQMEVTMIDMTSADFDSLEIGGRGGQGLCGAGDDNKCRGAEGRLKVYFESSGDDKNADKEFVTTTISDLLQDGAEEIARFIDEVQNLEFVKVNSNRSEILPPRSALESKWIIYPLIAGSVLVLYGLMIIVRESHTKSYRNVERDEFKNGLFAPDNKLRSDDIDIPESVEKKQWEDVQIIYDDGEADDADAFNRESLARSEMQFQMPSVDKAHY